MSNKPTNARALIEITLFAAMLFVVPTGYYYGRDYLILA